MKGSDSWDELKSGFTEQLAAFAQGEIGDKEVIDALDSILMQSDVVANNGGRQELSDLVSAANLPPDLNRLLLNKLIEQKTRIFPHPTDSNFSPSDSQAAADSKAHHTQSSSLLQDLLRWDASKERKNIKPGQIIRGTYQLDFKIGSGGMGEVWKALDLIQDAGESRDKYAAIKFINHEIRSHPDALKALVREFARYKKLIHPNIVKAYELNRDESEVFIAMEYLEGLSLKQFIKNHPEGISLKEAQPIIKAMCDALDYAHHEGIIHLDFKPGNVFYNPQTGIGKVIDFGIARLSSRQDRDKTRFDPGNLGAMTTAYASIEMLIQEEPDPRDDIYGLACVVYELLSGRHPFDKNLALKAEGAKMRPKPIQGLSRDEFNAILHGLSFHRNDRTPSAKQFYDELFSPRIIAEKKRLRQIIAGALTLLALILLPYLAYQAYDSWRFNRVKATISEGESEGLEDFKMLALQDQMVLVNDPALRSALLKLAATHYQKLDVLRFIEQLAPPIKQALLSNQKVREYLIAHFIGLIEQAIAADEFDRAQQLSQELLQQYPDSIQLMEHARSIEPKRQTTIAALLSQYRQCLFDISRPLLELSPCLLDSKERLRKIDDTISLPASATLTTRFDKETQSYLNNGQIEPATQLLDQWRSLEPQENERRAQLEQQLLISREIEALSEKLQSSDDNQLQQQITTLQQANTVVRQQTLSRPAVKQRLLQFYQDSVTAYLEENNFKPALSLVTDGINLFSGNRAEVLELKALAKSVQLRETRYLDSLTHDYQTELQHEEPNITHIQALLKAVSRVSPEHDLLTLPTIGESYSAKIDTAIDNEQFALAARLLNDWKALKPADSNSNTYKQLTEKRQAQLIAFQNREKLSRKLQQAIEGGQLKSIEQAIKDIKTTSSHGDQEKIINPLSKQLIAFYRTHIESLIQQDAYDKALETVAKLQAMLPDNRETANLENLIVASKNSRLKQLAQESLTAIHADRLQGQAIFNPLLKLRTIDSGYLTQNNAVFDQLKKRLLKLTDTPGAIPQLADVLNHWERFNNGGNGSGENGKEFVRKTKNLIALRCLFKGRNFKKSNQPSIANEYFMLGLSLEPIQTVREALEKELLK
ncbi:serine/threonine-protein kinase [Methylomarinum vadi]|uniref:serine/threonine-protein kinase n=1 Tax=Methylomarinum vadi TaxID=438855 RepID=UPI00068BA0AD|nr:protein kinase [Methylomarinum vadi]